MSVIRKGAAADIPQIAAIYDAIHTEEETGRAAIGWIRAIYPTRQTAADAIQAGDMYVAEEEEIPDESTPLTPTPPTEEDIPDEDTPLDGNPETGEPDGYLPVYMVLLSAAAAAICMATVLVSKKRRAGTNS